MDMKMKITAKPDWKKKDLETRKAIARTISYAVQDTIKDLQEHTRKTFTVRNHVDKSVYGTKSIDPNKLQASIWIGAKFMMDHEDGKTRTPQGNYFTVPTLEFRKEIGLNKVIPTRLRPTRILPANNRFIAGKTVKRMKSGKTIPAKYFAAQLQAMGYNAKNAAGGIFRRERGNKLSLLYTFQTQAKIKPRFKFIETGMKLYKEHFNRILPKMLAKL